MCLPDSCCETVKWVNTQTGASVLILPNLYEWLHLLQPPSPTVQSRWMGICWPPPHRQLSAVFEVKQHPWLGAKSIFSGGCCCCCYSRPRQAEPASERRTEGRDPHRCLIKVWSSGETENVCGAWPALASSPQRTLSTRRTPLHLFIAQRAHTTYNIRFHLWRGWGGGERQPRSEEKLCVHVLHMHRPSMRKPEGVEIKRKSKPVDVRTGCFQRCVPQHQLAGCAVTGSC